MNDPSKFKAPFIPKERIWQETEKLRATFPAGHIVPVQILELAEFDLGLELIPAEGLREQLEIDALLMGNLKSILVDRRAFMNPRLESRLRFSVAHEIGHLILHRDIYAGLQHATAAEWFDYISAIPDVEYGWVEWQAHEFAGRLLVPQDVLRAEFQTAVQTAQAAGYANWLAADEAALDYIATRIAPKFGVSAEVVAKRLRWKDFGRQNNNKPETTMSLLIPIEAFDNFKAVKDFPITELRDVLTGLVQRVKELDEREELEPWLRSILADSAQTPHGPAEIVDIFTHQVTADGRHGMAAFILKGKSFPTVKPADVAHQIYRLKKIEGLAFALFVAPGTILDAAKEQFCTTCEEIGCHYSVFNAEDLARLFIAYGFFCPRDGTRISSGRCKCGYSPNKRILNLLQKEALGGLASAHALGDSTGLIVLPPGSGKTRIAAEDAFATNANRVLYIAHTHEILDVAQSEFEAKFGAANIARLEKVTSLNNFSRVNIATIALLARHVDKLQTGQFDYLVIDEFHHAAAKSYRRVLEKLNPAFLLGLTATPFRGDQQNILRLCNNTIIVSHALRFGIETGVLCPYHYFGCFDNVDYSQIRHNGISYDIHDLERALIVPERDQAIIRKWREKAELKPTVAFCCSINHAARVAASFTADGISAVAYTSQMEKEQRQNVINKFKTGNISVLCVVDVLNEGADLPFVECLLFLRPTESKRIFFQQLGRGLRRYSGKPHCTVIDFIGNFKNANCVVEYQGLFPFGEAEPTGSTTGEYSRKSVFNLPLGCKVSFDEHVIELFYDQTLDAAYATRHNIRGILIHQYNRLARRLSRQPTKQDIDRNCLIGSDIYATCFGSWKAFLEAKANEKGFRHGGFDLESSTN